MINMELIDWLNIFLFLFLFWVFLERGNNSFNSRHRSLQLFVFIILEISFYNSFLFL